MYKHRTISVVSFLVFVFLFAPLFLIVLTAFNSADSISIPLEGFSFKWFNKVFASRSLMQSFKSSFLLAIVAALTGTLIGLFSAIAIVNTKSKYADKIYNIFLSPSLIPGIVTGYILFRFMVVFLQLPLIIALLIGHFLVVLPYTVRIICASLKNLDSSIYEAGMTLGCTPMKSFIKVVLPQLQSALISAFMLAFINSFNNIPVSMYLKAPGMNTLPYSMMNYIEYNYDPTVSALSVLLMLMTLFFMVLMDKSSTDSHGEK